MRYDELTNHQRFILRLIAEDPDFKASGLQLMDCNYLCSQKVVRHAGNLRYELEQEGRLLLQNDPFYSGFKTETIA